MDLKSGCFAFSKKYPVPIIKKTGKITLKKIIYSPLFFTERVGFEPTVDNSTHDFESCSLNLTRTPLQFIFL